MIPEFELVSSIPLGETDVVPADRGDAVLSPASQPILSTTDIAEDAGAGDVTSFHPTERIDERRIMVMVPAGYAMSMLPSQRWPGWILGVIDE